MTAAAGPSRARRTIAAPAPPAALVPRADLRQPWERYSETLIRRIAREDDELQRYLLRLELLKVRHTPYRRAG